MDKQRFYFFFLTKIVLAFLAISLSSDPKFVVRFVQEKNIYISGINIIKEYLFECPMITV